MSNSKYTIHPSCSYEYFVNESGPAVVCATPMSDPAVLQESGLAIWQFLAEGPISAEELVEAFNLGESSNTDDLSNQIGSFLKSLEESGILISAA